jgi:hypothetical protein
VLEQPGSITSAIDAPNSAASDILLNLSMFIFFSFYICQLIEKIIWGGPERKPPCIGDRPQRNYSHRWIPRWSNSQATSPAPSTPAAVR